MQPALDFSDCSTQEVQWWDFVIVFFFEQCTVYCNRCTRSCTYSTTYFDSVVKTGHFRIHCQGSLVIRSFKSANIMFIGTASRRVCLPLQMKLYILWRIQSWTMFTSKVIIEVVELLYAVGQLFATDNSLTAYQQSVVHSWRDRTHS